MGAGSGPGAEVVGLGAEEVVLPPGFVVPVLVDVVPPPELEYTQVCPDAQSVLVLQLAAPPPPEDEHATTGTMPAAAIRRENSASE